MCRLLIVEFTPIVGALVPTQVRSERAKQEYDGPTAAWLGGEAGAASCGRSATAIHSVGDQPVKVAPNLAAPRRIGPHVAMEQ